MSSKALIIPAAGAGTRMQRETPKPYLPLGGRSILEHTIRRFLPLEGLNQIIISTSEAYLERARAILQQIRWGQAEDSCVAGGDSRQQSIYNALQQVDGADLVLVHDAVRPFVQLEHIQACCRSAEKMGAAVLGVPARDTIKKVDEANLVRETPQRDCLWQSQTPQAFRKSILVRAYEQARKDRFTGTDDASLVERLGEEVKMVEGAQSNIKLTYPLDMKLAKILMNESANE